MYESIEETIQAFCEEAGYEYRSDYSGRGMYGHKCIGIVCSCSAAELMLDLGDYIVDNFDGYISIRDSLGGQIAEDNMGLDKIVYFPRLQDNESED